MFLLSFLAFVGFAALVALADWRRGWLLVPLLGVIQDPIRKITAGSPFWISFAVLGVYGAVLFGHQAKLQAHMNDFAGRFRTVWAVFGLLLCALVVAALNGIASFGISNWMAPVVSLGVYLAPMPAILIGYMFLDREERLYSFFRFYSVVTSIALVGSLLEFLQVDSRLLGMVAQQGDYIRHLPGIQIRMISGFYRGPDIMAWHAATLTSIALACAIRAGVGRRAMVWVLVAGWGFFNCLISGRRKAIYSVAVFVAVFAWRYFRRLDVRQFAAIVAAGICMMYVINRISTNEETSMYAAGASATRQEFEARLEGGFFSTLDEAGPLGAGLGSATQGSYHFTHGPVDVPGGWQEGGLGKLALEFGLPGIFVLLIFAFISGRVLFRIAAFRDLPSSAQITRVTLFSLVVANAANFLASAQTYSDPLLTLLVAFFVGCLFATAALDDRSAEMPAVAGAGTPATVTP